MPRTTLIKITPGRDPGLLREFLAAQFQYERSRAARELMVHVLAVVSALVWIVAVRPSLLGPNGDALAVALWGVALVLTVAIGFAEWASHRREEYLRRSLDVRELPPRKPEDGADE